MLLRWVPLVWWNPSCCGPGHPVLPEPPAFAARLMMARFHNSDLSTRIGSRAGVGCGVAWRASSPGRYPVRTGPDELGHEDHRGQLAPRLRHLRAAGHRRQAGRRGHARGHPRHRRPHWNGRNSKGYILRQNIECVLRYAVLEKHRPDNPAADLKWFLPKVRDVRNHRPSLPYREAPQAMADWQGLSLNSRSSWSFSSSFLPRRVSVKRPAYLVGDRSPGARLAGSRPPQDSSERSHDPSHKNFP